MPQGIRAGVLPYLPYLRRYSRALTGSQQSGDAYVRAALEALLADVDQFDVDRDPRVELFRLFHAIWAPVAAMSADTSADMATDPAMTDDRGPIYDAQTAGQTLLSELPRSSREALLLTAVEGFSVPDVCIILCRGEARVRADISAARDDMAAALAGSVLIIEDEAIIALHLQEIVEDMGHDVVGIASTHAEANALNQSKCPDLVLADIRLADGSSGIDAVNEILADRAVPIVFITAFPEHLLTGERPEPTYLVVKPFEVDAIVTTIGQALMMHRAGPRAA